MIEADTDELEYGIVEVSNDYSKKATIKNNSKIPVEYRAFTK